MSSQIFDKNDIALVSFTKNDKINIDSMKDKYKWALKCESKKGETLKYCSWHSEENQKKLYSIMRISKNFEGPEVIDSKKSDLSACSIWVKNQDRCDCYDLCYQKYEKIEQIEKEYEEYINTTAPEVEIVMANVLNEYNKFSSFLKEKQEADNELRKAKDKKEKLKSDYEDSSQDMKQRLINEKVNLSTSENYLAHISLDLNSKFEKSNGSTEMSLNDFLNMNPEYRNIYTENRKNIDIIKRLEAEIEKTFNAYKTAEKSNKYIYNLANEKALKTTERIKDEIILPIYEVVYALKKFEKLRNQIPSPRESTETYKYKEISENEKYLKETQSHIGEIKRNLSNPEYWKIITPEDYSKLAINNSMQLIYEKENSRFIADKKNKESIKSMAKDENRKVTSNIKVVNKKGVSIKYNSIVAPRFFGTSEPKKIEEKIEKKLSLELPVSQDSEDSLIDEELNNLVKKDLMKSKFEVEEYDDEIYDQTDYYMEKIEKKTTFGEKNPGGGSRAKTKTSHR
uniref:Uncharacterized protein n=1 Tax=viral metagenome TaxID=1070528 RepID=A0A6C0AF21_9ZZZZ